MDNPEQPDKAKQEAKATDTEITQPPAAPPQQPPAGIDARGTGDDPQPRNEPILVRLVGGNDLEPFEEQTLEIAKETLAISRRTYWIAIFGFGAALAAAIFVGVQVFEMTKQTQILASQSEGANAGALMDEMNTRRQLGIAQEQADNARQSVGAIRGQTFEMERPWVAVNIQVVGPLSFQKNGVQLPLTIEIKNIGHSPAQYPNPRAKLIAGWNTVTIAKLRSACQAVQQSGGANVATTRILYPLQSPVQSLEIAFASRKEIDEAFKDHTIRGKIGLNLITCIDYTMTSERSKLHHTEQLYAVTYIDPAAPSPQGAFIPEGDYQRIVLLLQPRNLAD